MKKFQHNYSDADVRSLFEDAMKLQGLVFDAKDSPIVMDGKTRYVKVSNRSSKNKNSRSGWYVGHLGDYPVGKFGWMHGENPSFSWSLFQYMKDRNENGVEFRELTPEEIEENRIKKEREEKRKKNQEIEDFNFSKALTIIEWLRSKPILNGHPYLTAKKLNQNECKEVRLYNQANFNKKEIEEILDKHFPEYNTPRNLTKLINYQIDHITFRGFNLIMRGMLIDGTSIMFQLIFDKKNKQGKNKHFPKMLKKHKSFLPLGARLGSGTEYVIICEGWATGKSIAKLTNNKITILIAWDSGNIKAVAKEIRRKLKKNVRIYVASDNDHLSPPEKNAGLISGLKTGNAVGAFLLLPPFDPNNQYHNDLSDWNDLDLRFNEDESRTTFRQTFRDAEYIYAQYEQGNRLNEIDEKFEDFSTFSDIYCTSVDFQYFAVSAIELISFGLQNCGLSGDEKLDWILENEVDIRNRYEINPIVYTQNDNKESFSLVSRAIFDFTNTVHLNSGFNVLIDNEAFSAVLSVIKENIGIVENGLNLVFDAFKHIHPIIISNAIMVKHLESLKFFSENHSEWQKDVIDRFFELSSEINIEFNIAELLTEVSQSKEVIFWQGASKEARINMAVDHILSVLSKTNDSPKADIKEMEKMYAVTKGIDQILIELSVESSEPIQARLKKGAEYIKDNFNESFNNIITEKIKLFMIEIFKKAY